MLKRHINFLFRATLVLALFTRPSFAVNEYYSLSRSIRAMGMGGAFYGLSDDEYALFYNPAGLSLYPGPGTLMLSFNGTAPSQIGQLINTIRNAGSYTDPTGVVNAITPYQGTALSAGFGIMPFYVRKNFAIGLLIADTKINAALLGNNFDSSIDVTGISDSGLVIGYGRTIFTDNLHVGFNTKILGRVGGHKLITALDLVSPSGIHLDLNTLGGAGIGLDFDLGSTYELPVPIIGTKNRLSLVFNNLLATTFSLNRIQGAPPALPRLMSLGSEVVFPGFGWIDNFNVLLDFAEFQIGGQTDTDLGARAGSFFKHVNLGVEVPMNKWFVVRTGLHQGDFTAGIGIETQLFKLELATYAEQLDFGLDRLPSRRYALRVAFGDGTPPSPKRPEAAAEPEPKAEIKPETKPETKRVPPVPAIADPPVQERKPMNEAPMELPKVVPPPEIEHEVEPEPEPKIDLIPVEKPVVKAKQIERQPAKESVKKSKPRPDIDRFDTNNLAKEAYGK